MSSQFFISLLNPLLAFAFAGAFAVFWLRWRQQGYLTLIALAFACCGLAFIGQDFSIGSYEGISFSGNALFILAIALACSAALIRTGIRPPLRWFGLIGALGAAAFLWYVFGERSLIGRIMVVSAMSTLYAGISALLILRARPRSAADRLMATSMTLLLLIAIARPLLTALGLIDISSPTGLLRDSPYWSTVQAFTPLLAIAVAGTFFAAVLLDVMDHMKSEADRDFLTGLLNRRGFETAARTRLSLPRHTQHAPALLLADIDDFKTVNDTYGHTIGDGVIAAVAEILSSHGHADLAGRVGGEEFCLFYTSIHPTELQVIAESIRVQLRNVSVPGLATDHALTLSMGLHIRDTDETLAAMQSVADQALYRAKREGKNRAVFTGPALRSVAGGKA